MIYHTASYRRHCIILAVFLIFSIPIHARADIMSADPDVIVISKDECNDTANGLYYSKNNIYFYTAGSLQTGWQTLNGQTYYFSVKTGAALKGKQRIKNDIYYFSQDGWMQTGWIKLRGKKYYFDDKTGKMLTGWQKIDRCHYYLLPTGADKGSLQVNCIAGNKKDGFYYTDHAGIQINTPEINAAVRFIKNYTKDQWTPAEKLQKCYETLQQHYYYLPSQENPTAQNLSAFAYDLLTNERGNCYRYAAGLACIAKVLGYDCRICIGYVDGRYGELLPHGWAEVKKDGIWCKCDVNMNLFMHAETTSHQYKYLETYKLLTQKGKAYWNVNQK